MPAIHDTILDSAKHPPFRVLREKAVSSFGVPFVERNGIAQCTQPPQATESKTQQLRTWSDLVAQADAATTITVAGREYHGFESTDQLINELVVDTLWTVASELRDDEEAYVIENDDLAISARLILEYIIGLEDELYARRLHGVEAEVAVVAALFCLKLSVSSTLTDDSYERALEVVGRCPDANRISRKYNAGKAFFL